MRVLIADDESLARSNLRSILQELRIPLRIVGEAANGEELIELVKRYTPDVAFVDIRMPKVDGLEAIRVGKTFSPHTKWFILTGFSEFEYAKEAIRLGATDYLLKPVDLIELEALLRKAYDDCNERLSALNRQFERDMMALYHGVSSLQWEAGGSYLTRADFIGGVFYFDSHLPEKSKAERQIALCQKTREIIDDSITNSLRIALVALPNGELAVVVAWLSDTSPLGRHVAEDFLRRLEEIIRSFDSADLKVTLLQTDQCGSYDVLNARLGRIQELAAVRAVAGIGKRWHVKELELHGRDDRMMDLARCLAHLCEVYQEGSYLDFMQMLPGLESAFVASGIQENGPLKKQVADFLNCALYCQVRATQSIDVWTHLIEERGAQLLTQAKSAEQPDLVNRVVAYIDAHYQHDIGVGLIAEQLKITPNYLSTMFHRRTGTTFVRYLTNTRMLKAQELLTDPNLQIQQVAERVGYYSTRYFTKLFTEFTGSTPSEYRRMRLAQVKNR